MTNIRLHAQRDPDHKTQRPYYLALFPHFYEF